MLAHAVIDALLGAAGLGDIGEHFPDTEERWRDADSIELLRRGGDGDRPRALQIVTVDCTVMMERPKLAPHREAIRDAPRRGARAGAAAGQREGHHGEGMGFVGRGEGVAALAVASLRPMP